jgi:ABC-type branched-subunit amino acid transport system ATPase component
MGADDLRNTLEVDSICKSFGAVAALSSVSFEVASGTVTALIGPNGAGKSTLLNVLSGFDTPDCGSVRLRGESIIGLSAASIARKGVSRTFQQVRLFPHLTVAENLMLALESAERETVWFGLNCFARYEASRIQEAVEQLLHLCDLQSARSSPASALSHGQRRMLEVLRAVAQRSNLYLFDEPSAGLAPALCVVLDNILLQLGRSGKALLLVEHNLDVVRKVAARVIALRQGKVVADGSPEEVLAPSVVASIYFGND